MITLAAGKMAAAAMAAGLVGLAATFSNLQPATPPDMRTITLDDGTSLAVARHEVTRGEWQQCHDEGACELAADGDANLPMTGVNAFDVNAYITWINRTTSGGYRLPTQLEWRAAAHEMPQPAYKKLFTDPRLAWAADYNAMPTVPQRLRPVGGFGSYRNGVADLAGNVWEWTSSCAAVGRESERCPAFIVEGQHAAVISVFVRDPATGGCSSGTPPAHVGFRLVRD